MLCQACWIKTLPQRFFHSVFLFFFFLQHSCASWPVAWGNHNSKNFRHGTLDVCLWLAMEVAAVSVSRPLTSCPRSFAGSREMLLQTSRYKERFLQDCRAAAIAPVWSSWPTYTHLFFHFKHRGTPLHTLAYSGCPNTPLARWRLMFQAWPCWAADYRRIDGSEKPGLVTEMGCLPQRAPELGGMVLLSAPSEERTPFHNSSSFSPATELSCPQGPQRTPQVQNCVREGSENGSVCQVKRLCFNMSE